MPNRRVVVDGSNLATEGRTLPSLAQLDEAVQEFAREYPGTEITVVVDGTFGYRIDESERKMFEEAEDAGEIVSPPAGAIGRGDAFVLRIAEKVGATVLSNDSFQEFHGEHDWLFDKDRLIGGKPVPGVGWIFTPRAPVRGPRSRQATQAAKRVKKADGPAKTATKRTTKAAAATKRAKLVEKAIEVAVEEAVAPDSPSVRRRRRRRGGGPPPEPVNEPLTFITFAAEHPPGSEVTGTVDSFSSHGAFVTVGHARCYLPLSGISDPPPTSARRVLARGETRPFRVENLDTPRRGIELSLVAGAGAAPTPAAEPATEAVPTAAAPARKRTAKKAPVAPKKAAATRKAPAAPKKSPAQPKKAVAPKKAAPVKKTAVKKTAVKKTAVKKAPAPPKAAATKKVATAKRTTKKPAAKRAKKA